MYEPRNQSKLCLLKCACMFNALIIETIKQRILTMPYKLNKVLASLTSSSGFMKILNCGEKYAKKPAKHPNTGNRKLLLGYEQWKAEAKVTRTRFTHSWRNNNLNISLQSYFNNLSSLDCGGFEVQKCSTEARWYCAMLPCVQATAHNVRIEIMPPL